MIFSKIIRVIAGNTDSQEIVLKSAYSLIFRVLSYVLGFAFIYLIAKFFGLETQGVFSISFTLIALITLIARLGLQTAMVKWLSNYFYHQELGKAKYFYLRVYKLALISSLILAIGLYFLSDWIALFFFNKNSLIKPIKIISFTIPFLTSTEIIANYFRSKKNVIAYSFYNFTSKFILPLILLGIALLFLEAEQRNSELVIYTYSFGVISIGVIAKVHVFKDLFNIKSSSKDAISYRVILNTSIPLLFSSSLVMIMWWSDTFILGAYKSEADVGIYSVSVKIATVVSFIYSAVTTILLPKIARFYNSNEKVKLANIIQYSSKFIFIATLPITLVLVLFPDFFLGIFGQEYKAGKVILILLLIAQFTNSLSGPVGPLLNMSGHEKQQLYFIVIALILNLVISLILVHDYGGVGVAFGSAVGMMSWNIIGAIYIKKKLGYQTWIKI